MPANPRVAKAFRAMRDLGISEDKVKPVLKNLLKLYDKNWDLIEEENYRALADAIFDDEEAKAAQTTNNLENTDQERVLREEAQEQDEPGRPLKKLCLNYQGQASESCNNSTGLAGTNLIIPKDEPVELPEIQLQNQVQSMVSTKSLNNGNRRTEPQHVSCQSLDRSKEKQPVSPKPLTLREITDTPQHISGNKSQKDIPATIESAAVLHPPSVRNRGKEALSPHSASAEKRLESAKSSQLVHQENSVGMHPGTSREGDPSRINCSEQVQNGAVPLAESLGGKDASNGVLETIPDESSSQLEIASSPLGEVKICLSYNISSPVRPGFQVPSQDAVVKLVEDRCLKSYKHLDPNFSLMKLMKDMCESVLELGSESCNETEETN